MGAEQMFKKMFAAVAVLALLSSPALARHCPKDMAEIDAALAKNPSIGADKLAQVKELRAKGEQQHKAGDHPASEATLAQAKTLLGLK